ncbi:sulfatase [Streptomyces sp. NBC_00151]|uniref:sulfatase n=1 Tax=Streptomyces sp. NBC_00151 TaxID=2975669 RepID=UPI002DDBD230|nr:sulfatase [Streptomyces sp. NBC_00151]WRZ43646.1 sulfatase [Streptomyces sp. NBC_00151]
MSHHTPPRQLPDADAGPDPDATAPDATRGDSETAERTGGTGAGTDERAEEAAGAAEHRETPVEPGVPRPAAHDETTTTHPADDEATVPHPADDEATVLHTTAAPDEPDVSQDSTADEPTVPQATADDEGTVPQTTGEDEPTVPDPTEEEASSGAADRHPSEPASPDDAEPAADAASAGRPGWRRRHPRAARAVRVGTTVLAAALVVTILIVPNRLDWMRVQAFFRLPVEAVFLSAVLLVLPARARRVTAGFLGVLLGVSAILKCLDMGFRQTLARPFDLVFDWVLLSDGADWVKDSFGRSGEVLAVVGVIVLVIAVLALSVLAMMRLANVLARHRTGAVRATLALGVAWVVCFTMGVQNGGVTIATKGYAQYLSNRVQYVRDGLGDADVYKKQMAVDAFAKTPSDQLLTGLRGKDVMLTFIESYGRVAIDDPAMGPEVDATLKEGDARLKAAGFSARSGWLKSPVTGAGSWLAHSTFLSGTWVKNQQRYRSLTTSDRATLTSYFQKTGAWRTVGIVPGVRKAWPEGKYFGLDHIYDSTHLGYQGPYFSWTPVPDQFSLESFQKLEHGKKNRDPIMAEIILASSHNPWSPIAHTIDWKDLGDGKVFYKIKKEGTNPTEVWKSSKRVRTEYRKAIQYSLDSLTQWVQRYGDDNTVLVFLGDHQPVPTVTGGSTSKDVPVTIVARDPKVLDRVSDWGWTDGLKPAADAPEWAMNKFRDRFMTAYGPNPGAGAATTSH